MTKQLFKPGDKVRCAFYGDEVFTLVLGFCDSIVTLNRAVPYRDFFSDGKIHRDHTHPVLTMVEPKKEPLRIEIPITWIDENLTIIPVPDKGFHLDTVLIGKRGKLIFEETP